MVYGVVFGEKHSFRDWKLLLNERPKIEPPLPKLTYIEIPGADGTLDLTEFLGGDVVYERRKMEFTFITTKARKQWSSIYSEIQNCIHGQEMKIILDEDQGFYYFGRVSVNEWKSDVKYSTIAINAEVDPYKYERYGSLDDWLWDPFCFEGGIIRNYKNLKVEGKMILMIPGQRKKVVPVFDCSAQMTVEYEEKSYSLPIGRSKIPDIQIGFGEHFLTFTGNGIINVDYRGGSL